MINEVESWILFADTVQPPMSKARLEMVDRAFNKMDKTGDGIITVEDLKLAYSVSQHPKFLSGEKTEDELLKKFMDVFQPGDSDDKVLNNSIVVQILPQKLLQE